MILNKKERRLRKSLQTRYKIKNSLKHRLVVSKTNKNIYASIVNFDGSKVELTVSSLSKEFKSQMTLGGNKKAAAILGEMVAKKSLEIGFKDLVFDRSGYSYHGRVKELAESARQNGLNF